MERWKRNPVMEEMHFLAGKRWKPVCLLESSFFYKVNSEKVNYFLIFSSVMKNKLENTFQCLVMSWKMS